MPKPDPITIDFAKEKEAGYQRVYARSPLLSSTASGWDRLYFAYDYLPPGETGEIVAKQHGVAIFSEMPAPVLAERSLDGCFRHEEVAQGDILVVPAEVTSCTRWYGAGGIILLGFEPTVFDRIVGETAHSANIKLTPHFATPDPFIYQLGLTLKTTLETYGVASRLYAETMTNALIVHLLQYYSSRCPVMRHYTGGLPQHKLQQVIDYIQAHLSQDFGLEDLAAVAQMSAHYFSQLFKQATGTTPHQFVISSRIERSKELLRQKHSSIAEVARCVGFVDQSHFHRHFKRLVGMTPRTFQQQFKK